MALHPNGVHHLAISTKDMKAQLSFFAKVLGCPTKALYWMHGVEGCYHGFAELSESSYLAFVQHPDNADEVQWGITHAGNGGESVTKGAMQHVAFNVKREELDGLVEHVRSCGVEVAGPFSLGDRFWSAYFYDPSGIRLELATSLAPEDVGIVGSARQTEEEARAELATLFDDEAEIDRWLAEMPLLAEELQIDIPSQD